MKFLGQNGVLTLWNKIKNKFLPCSLDINVIDDGGDTFFNITDVNYGDFLKITSLTSSTDHTGVEMIFNRPYAHDGNIINDGQKLSMCGRGIIIKSLRRMEGNDADIDVDDNCYNLIDISCPQTDTAYIRLTSNNEYIVLTPNRISASSWMLTDSHSAENEYAKPIQDLESILV